MTESNGTPNSGESPLLPPEPDPSATQYYSYKVPPGPSGSTTPEHPPTYPYPASASEQPTSPPQGGQPWQAPPSSYQQQGYPPQGYPQPPYPQPGYPPQGYPQPGYSADGYPQYEDTSAKSRMAAGLLGIFLGAFGIHRFYLGYTGVGIAMLLITVLSFGLLSWVSGIWGFIEGILYLTDKTGNYSRDARGVPLRD